LPAEPPLQFETAAIEQPQEPPPPETAPASSRDSDRGHSLDPDVHHKVKQLEALESEMEEELQRLRDQRQKLINATK
jgi:hypothetical protein